MTTTLAAQLRQLSVPSTKILKDDKRRSTLLFDPKEAAGISAEVIYQIGLEGLEELILKNDDFRQFKQSLFHATSKDFDRNVHSKEDNIKVNKIINKFLVILAPYFITNSAHKALEWLFYRYNITEFNRKELVMAAIPYYNSNIFSRILQTLKLNDPADPFYFLRTVQKTGMQLQRLDIFSHTSFIKYLTKFMTQLIHFHKNHNILTTQFNFYCTVFCGAIEFGNEITEQFISQLLPLILKGLDSSISDFAAASFVITARLLSRGLISDKLLNTFVEKVSKLKSNSLKLEATLLLVLIYQLQTQYQDLPPAALANFSNSDWIPDCLQYLHTNGNCVYPFLKVLVQKAVHQGVHENQSLPRKLISNIVNKIEFDGYFTKVILRLLLDAVDEETISDEEIKKWLHDNLKNLELKYPSDLDLAVGDILKDDSKRPSKKVVLRNIFGSVNDSYATKFQILNKLYDDDSAMNNETLKSVAGLIRNLKSSDQYLVSNVLCEKLYDQNSKIVERTLEFLIKTDVGETKLLQTNLMNFFKSAKLLVKKWEKSYDFAANYMIKDQEFTWDMFISLFPYIVLCCKRQSKEMQQLFESEFFTESKLFTEFEIASWETSDLALTSILSCIHDNSDDKIFESFLNFASLQADENCITKYSCIIILSIMFPGLSYINDSSINKVFKIFDVNLKKRISTEESTLEGYLQKALKNKLPLKGFLDCMNNIIIRAIDKKINLATMDFYQNSGHSCFITGLCSLAFSNSIFENMFNLYLSNISSDINIQIGVSLNICASDILNEPIVCKVLTFIHQITTEKSVRLDKLTCLYLLVLCSNPTNEIRQLGFDLTDHLVKRCYESNTNYIWLLKKILSYKEEIIADYEQIALICFNLLAPINTDTDLKLANGKVILTDLLKVACSREIPIYVKARILKVLSHINSFEICQVLCEHFLELKNKLTFNGNESAILLNLINRLDLIVMPHVSFTSCIWHFIIFILNCKQDITINTEKIYLPTVLLNQFSRDIYAVLSDDVLKKLLDNICEIVVTSEEPEVVSLSSKIFKHMDLNAKLISSLLSGMSEVQSNRASSTKSRRVHIVPTVDILDTTAWKKGICVLEFIQCKKKIRNAQLLLPLLFDILKKCLDFEEQAIVEYPKQLTLSLILLICSKLEEDNISEKDFNIELVIQCIRASQNPQTHYHALLALAHAAKFVPKEVLHHVMAVFTFMGSTLIRHDDAYGFEIISKIVDTIVPILVSEGHMTTIADVLRVFVDALLDVPEHRRIPLYSKLLSKINQKDNFYLFLLLILEAEVFQTTREKHTIKKGVTSLRIKIALVLCQEFSTEITLHACVQLAKYLNDLPDDKVDMRTTQTENSPVNITNYNAKQFRHYKYLIITFLSNLLTSRTFVNNISLLSNQDNINMEPLYKELIINVLSYIQRIQRVCEKSANTPQSLYWKTVLYHSYDLLDSVNDLLTPHMFLLVIKGLLVHSTHSVKKRALELLNNKLQYNLSVFNDQDKTDLYILVRPILLIIETIGQDTMQSDQETLIQTALLSLKLIGKTLGPQEPEKFAQILEFVANILNLGKARDNVLASIILCLAEFCIVLRGHGIPGLTSFMPAFLTTLKKQKYQETSSMLLLSVVTTINKLLDSFAAFLSPYLKTLVCETSILLSKWNCSADDPKSQALVSRLNGIKKKISLVIPPRILIPTIEDSYNALIAKRYYNALVALINIMEEQLANLKFSDINSNMPELTNFFLKALQFRCDNTSTLDVADLVESQVVKAVTVFILKLSESTFRPFYLKLYDWTVRTGSNRERLITFYHLSESIARSLKGLFVLFAGHILNNLSEVLRSTTSENAYFDDKDKNILLLEYALKTLQVIFTYDNKKLINRDRFELLMQPLVDLLEKDIDGLDALIIRNEKLITPTIVHFSLAIADDSLWKEMNYQILLKMRNSNPEVRLIALHCLTEVVSKLREDFLPLLPETIPFLAELLEDEDEKVERSCQKTIREMEKMLGEPLQKYF